MLRGRAHLAQLMAGLAVSLLMSVMLVSFPLIINHSSGLQLEGNTSQNGLVAGRAHQSSQDSTPLLSANSSFWYVGASSNDTATQSNQGVGTSVQVRDQAILEGVLSFWVSESFSNNLWAQVGYFIEPNSNPQAFYQVWNLTANSEVATSTASLSNGLHFFSISELGKSSVWCFYVDNESLGTTDMSTNMSGSSLPIYAMSEEGYSSAPFSFKPVIFSSAIQVLESGKWYSALNATSFGSSWGMEGQNQNSELLGNQLIIGEGNARILAGTTLWS